MKRVDLEGRGGYAGASSLVRVGISQNGAGDGLYVRIGGALYYTALRGADTKVIGTSGWDNKARSITWAFVVERETGIEPAL